VSLVRLRPVWMTNHPPSVPWYCWFGHQTCKNRRLYNLYCVGADVKPCSINQSTLFEKTWFTKIHTGPIQCFPAISWAVCWNISVTSAVWTKVDCVFTWTHKSADNHVHRCWHSVADVLSLPKCHPQLETSYRIERMWHLCLSHW